MCRLWTPAQLVELGLRVQPSSRTDQEEGRPRCAYRNDGQPPVDYSLRAFLDEDVTVWLGPGQVEQTALTEVAGFPAVQVHGATTTIGCDIYVSTVAGQYLAINMASVTPDAFTIQQMCDRAKKAATFATQTLLTLK